MRFAHGLQMTEHRLYEARSCVAGPTDVAPTLTTPDGCAPPPSGSSTSLDTPDILNGAALHTAKARRPR